MKLTKKQVEKLNLINKRLELAIRYLQQEGVFGVAHKTESPDGHSYTINNKWFTKVAPEHVNIVSKDIGSDLCLIYKAYRELKDFIDKESI